jgi:DNA-binding beta-propeller fold protein YncE
VTGSEGLAIDSATGRLYWANFSTGPGNTGGIRFAGLGGGDGGQLNTGGATVNEPSGIAIDPTTRTLYWTNYDGGNEGKGTISWAKLDGSAAGDLNTSGATVDDPGQIALDTAGGRVYWGNYGDDTISFANLNNSGGGGNLDLSGASPPSTITGLSVSSATGQIYWIDNDGEHISHANLGGGGGGDFDLGGAVIDDPYGLAFDPATGRVYWGNYGVGIEPTAAFAFTTAGGGGGNINIATAPVDGPQNPVILKAPSGTGAPAITRTPKTTNLACSQGSWAADYAGSFVYQAPHTYAYQWNLNGVPIAGATASSYTATAPGSYTCTVTAANVNGSTAQVSAAVPINAAKFKLALKSGKASTRPGHKATFRVVATNTGDLASAGAKLCVKAPKKAGKEVKAPKCASLKKIAGGAKGTLKLKVGARKSAEGRYKLTFRVRGAKSTKAVKATLVVKAPKG